MTTLVEGSSHLVSHPNKAAVGARGTQPIAVWALLGIAVIAVQAYVYGSWILSGDATPTPHGATPVPRWMTLSARGWEGASLIILVVILYRLVIRPWRREGQPRLDGILFIGFLSLYWQDPIVDYVQPWFTYNTAFVNFGSWAPHIPGWVSPNMHRLPEPLLFIGPMYGITVLLFARIGNAAMRRAKAHWPRIDKLGLVLVCLGTMMVMDVILEPLWLRFGLISYPGAIEGWTLFHGKYYQYPLYQAPLAALFFGSFACLRYFKNDRGETLAERGLSTFRLSPGRKTGLRILAVIGACNLCFALGYNVPAQIFAIHSDVWPEDITKRSYLTDGLCGPGTDYACPGPGTPINRNDSSHLNPAGVLSTSSSR